MGLILWIAALSVFLGLGILILFPYLLLLAICVRDLLMMAFFMPDSGAKKQKQIVNQHS